MTELVYSQEYTKHVLINCTRISIVSRQVSNRKKVIRNSDF